MPSRILVIDDNPLTLRLYKLTLTLEGYTCMTQATPVIAIDEVAQLAPHLLLLDWFQGAMMTATSVPTIELLSALRHDPRAVPVLRAYEDWFAAQGVSLLGKPLVMDVLVERNADVLGRS